MWDTFRLSTGGNFSLRKIALLFVAVLTSALFVAITNSTTTYADTATWEGDTIKYQNKTYRKVSPAPTLPGIKPENQQIYMSDENGEVSVIALKDDSDKAKEITDAQIGSFKRDEGNNYTSAGPPTTLTVSASVPGANEEGESESLKKTSCAVDGIGWIICGPSRFIAGGMDKIYEWIQGFLTVKPLTTDTNSGMFQAWEIARGLANACFILAFLVIIYSHMTTMGINNYEIKKMIPKLIIAAILVNVSYYICTLAIDVSNILGDSVQQALIDIRGVISSYGPSGDFQEFSWENITEYILSGGTLGIGAVAGIGALITASGGSVVSLVFLLFPILVMGILSVLIALAILAARQAIITVLVIIAPLAFVAYLLPNTEKFFERWRGLFTTMLMVFPLFSLLFGGSQLASALIIQNADQASVIILALFIQVAPLVVTPFLIQFSGSLLGRFAGMLNNPQKGIVDRTRGWSKERADLHAARAMSRGANITRRFPSSRRRAYKRDMDRRQREEQTGVYRKKLDAAWANDSRAHTLGVQMKRAELSESMGHAETELHYEAKLADPKNKAWQHMQARQLAAQAAVKNYQSETEIAWNEAGSAFMGADNRFAAFHDEAMAQSTKAQANAYRNGTAQAMQKIDYAKALTNTSNPVAAATAHSLAQYAGGIDPGGSDSARANALMALNKSKLESIAEGRRLSQHYNLTSSKRQALARGETVEGIADDGSRRLFNAQDSEYVFLSAVEDQITNGTVKEKLELVLKTGLDHNGNKQVLYDHREIVTDAMLKGGLPQQATFMSGQIIDEVRNGKFGTYNDIMRAAAIAIAKGKYSAETLVNQDKTSVEMLVKSIGELNDGNIPLGGEQLAAISTELDRLFASAETTMRDPRVSVRLGERANAMTDLVNIGRKGTNFTNPTGGEPLDVPEDTPSETPFPDDDIDSGV